MEPAADTTSKPPRLARDIEAWLYAGANEAAPLERVIETSISWVFLFADRALKLKKPVDLGFVDFTSVEKRGWAAHRELAFNRATAPDIYRRVLPITRDANGRLAFGGTGETVDWALEMRRFDETATLANRLAEIDGPFAERLGREIGRFHTAASAGQAGGGARGFDYVLRSNARLLSGESAELGAAEVERLISSADAAFSALAALLDRRAAEGFVRCCHGDLHLGNILLEHGAPILFDCLEFNDTLREIDVLYDIAFLLMDLSFRGAHEAANRVLNGWLDQAARGFGPRFWEGAAALALFQSARAAVRAHVNVLEKRHDDARAYLAAAQDYLEPRPPVLVAVGGLSGSGKTTLARALAPALGRRPGAIILRSDEVRKRLWGVGPTDRLPSEAYTPEAGAIVYDALFTTASTCLAAGWAVIVDAVFLKPEERRGIGALAGESGAKFQGVWLDAPAETLRDRLRRRRGDASDADERVLDIQLAEDAGAIDWPRHPGAGSPAALAVVQEWLR